MDRKQNKTKRPDPELLPPELVERAIASGVRCVILCRADTRPEWANVKNTCIL